MRNVARPDEHRAPRDHSTVGELDSGQAVVLDHQPRDLAANDPQPACLELGLLCCGQVIGVDEERHVVGPLPHQQRMLDRARQGAENADRLVAHLPPVAIGAVQEIPPPPLADPRDLGQLVADTGCDQDPPSRYHAATGTANHEPGLDPDHAILDHVDAVAPRLDSSRCQEVDRRHPVAGQKSLHVGRRSVARRSGIDHRDPAPCPAQHQSGAQAGRAPADHHHVIARHLRGKSPPRGASG
jgi:hypothetical protein